MNISICARNDVEKMLAEGTFPANTAVVSFCDPEQSRTKIRIMPPVDYREKAERVFLVRIHDLDRDSLHHVGLTEETYFPDADKLAQYIKQARKDGLDILCQCEYGQSRSSACAAAILQHFEKRGIDIFADYRYYPNQLVYHKIFDALERCTE